MKRVTKIESDGKLFDNYEKAYKELENTQASLAKGIVDKLYGLNSFRGTEKLMASEELRYLMTEFLRLDKEKVLEEE